MNKNKLRLKHFVLYSWLITGGIALFASLVLFLGLGYFNYSKNVESMTAELTEKANKAARRISAELLIAPHGSPEAVRLQLQQELGIDQIEILPDGKKIKINKEQIQVKALVPHLETKYFIVASKKGIRVWDHINFLLLIGCFTLIGIILAVGLWLQIKYLNKHLIHPIKSLVATSTGEKFACEDWPLELQEISEKLNNSFKERDQVVYSQVARGVIHDIRTLLQSLQVATDLANEKPSEERLKNLLAVSKSKMPNLLGIINTALDGSREITIAPVSSDLVQTIKNSIDTNQAFAIAKKIQIEFQNMPATLLVAHDPIQLERAFTNILKNAVEAVDTPSITDKKIKVTCEQSSADKITVSVEDNGHGLSAKPESVFRLLKSTKSHGSGLGLLVSRKIVEAHRGQIIASKSKDLNGAKFEILIPSGEQL